MIAAAQTLISALCGTEPRIKDRLSLLLTASALVHPAPAALAVLFAAMVAIGRAQTQGVQPGKGSFKAPVLVLAVCTVLLLVMAATYAGFETRLLLLRLGLPGLVGLAITEDVPAELKLGGAIGVMAPPSRVNSHSREICDFGSESNIGRC